MFWFFSGNKKAKVEGEMKEISDVSNNKGQVYT